MRTAVRPTFRLPLQPRELGETGLCATHPNPGWWTSARPLEREAAAVVCGYCPALELCRTWALGLPLADNAIYAAMDSRARRQARQVPEAA